MASNIKKNGETNLLSKQLKTVDLSNSKDIWIRERFGWMGNHSGYDQLFTNLELCFPSKAETIWSPTGKPINKWLHKLISRLTKDVNVSPFYNSSNGLAELFALWQAFLIHPNLVHVSYVENSLGLLSHYKDRLDFKLVGTVHQPSSWWKTTHPHPESIEALDAVIVLSSSDKQYFEKYLPGKVHFVPHGVDIEYFKPADNANALKSLPRCVLSGTWLRDLETLAKVIDAVLIVDQSIQFDLIIPLSKRNNPHLHRISRHNQVNWHSNLSDEELRKLYQTATLLFLPLLDCTANNGLLEGIACGLPIVSNNVGGMPDYTEPSFADLLPVGDVQGLVNAILRLVNSPEMCNERGSLARNFAEDNLNWYKIASQMGEIYKFLTHTS